MREGTAIVISAPSGAGKSTLCKKLLEEFPNIHYSISCTTRAMRPGEIDGRDYFFISVADFNKKRGQGSFAEWAEVHGNFYGTPLEAVQEELSNGHDLLFDVDIQGASQLKLSIPDARLVFILPPNMNELELRLRRRNFDDENNIRTRINAARQEIREAGWYHAIIINNNLEKAYDEFRAFYIASTLAPVKHASKIAELLADK